MKYIGIILCLLIWTHSNGNLPMIELIRTTEFNVVNQKYRDLKVKSETRYSNEDSYSHTDEYDTLGRIVASFNQAYFGEQYYYIQKDDTLIRLEYESRNGELLGLNSIEKFVYNGSGKLKTCLTTYKSGSERALFNEKLDSNVVIELNEIFYDSLERIEKIEHYSKTMSNQVFNLDLKLVPDTTQPYRMDLFEHNIQQTKVVRLSIDTNTTETQSVKVIYDSKGRVVDEIYSFIWGKGRIDTMERKYVFDGHKKKCYIKKDKSYQNESPIIDYDEVRTEIYNDSGLIVKMTNLRVQSNSEDTILVRYEFH